MAVFFTSHKKTKNATDTLFIPLFNSGKQDGGYIYPKDGRWGGGTTQPPLRKLLKYK
jgi:hypothetical protein